MSTRIQTVLVCAAAALFTVLPLQAGHEPFCSTEKPLHSLAGTWAFEIDGFNYPPTKFLASAGRFTARVGADRAGSPLGILSVTQTASIDGGPARLEMDAGRYQISSDCTGGTLTFNVSSRPDQYDFFFVNEDRIVFVSNRNGSILKGYASRVVWSSACPANALNALTGTWVFSFDGFSYPPARFLSAAGRFTASIGPKGTGVVKVTQTSSIDGSQTRLETDAGSFQLDSGCASGHLILNVSSRPVQLDFYFASQSRIVFVGSNNGDIVSGSAQRYDPK